MIGNGLLLTPRELYCLGGILNAKYIDYAYIAALDDAGQDFRCQEPSKVPRGDRLTAFKENDK